MRLKITLAALTIAAPLAASTNDLLYTLERSAVLTSSETGWDYAKMEPGGNRLFIARDKDGLTVFDVDSNKEIATVANSVGANGPLLLPKYDRGYVAMTDGSLLSFHLKTLKPIARVKLTNDGGLNSAVYDPATHRIHAITSDKSDGTSWHTLDAATGKIVSEKAFPFAKMDDPAVDGRGTMYAPARNDKLILKLDSKTLTERARWTAPCNVSKVRFQPETNRLLAACYGENPKFFAIDVSNGQIVATLPIGRGIDGFAIDEKRRRIVTSNGTDGTLTVIGQDGPDRYRLLGAVSTRPAARMMHMDERTGKLLIVAASYTENPVGETDKNVRTYHPNSFTVLTYIPR